MGAKRALRRCKHEGYRMIVYLSTNEPTDRASVLWCPSCGAICLRSVEALKSVDRWQLPEPAS